MYYSEAAAWSDWAGCNETEWSSLYEEDARTDLIAVERLPLPLVLARQLVHIQSCTFHIRAGRPDDIDRAQARSTSTCDNALAVRRCSSCSAETDSSPINDDLPLSQQFIHTQARTPATPVTDLPLTSEIPQSSPPLVECNITLSPNGHNFETVIVEPDGNAHLGDINRTEIHNHNGMSATQVGATLVVGTVVNGTVVAVATGRANAAPVNVHSVTHAASCALPANASPALGIVADMNPPHDCQTGISILPDYEVDLQQICASDGVKDWDDDEKTIAISDVEGEDNDGWDNTASESKDITFDNASAVAEPSDDRFSASDMVDNNEFTCPATEEPCLSHSTTLSRPASNGVPSCDDPAMNVTFEVISPHLKVSTQLLHTHLNTSADLCVMNESVARTLSAATYKWPRVKAPRRRIFVNSRVLWSLWTVRLHLRCMGTRYGFLLDVEVVRDHDFPFDRLVLSQKVILRHHLLCRKWLCWTKIKRRIL